MSTGLRCVRNYIVLCINVLQIIQCLYNELEQIFTEISLCYADRYIWLWENEVSLTSLAGQKSWMLLLEKSLHLLGSSTRNAANILVKIPKCIRSTLHSVFTCCIKLTAVLVKEGAQEVWLCGMFLLRNSVAQLSLN